MEPFENEIPQQDTEVQQAAEWEQTAQPQETESCYHGEGAGQRERIFIGSPYVTYQYPPQTTVQQPWDQGVYQQPWQQNVQTFAAPEKPKKKRGVWKKLIAAVLAVGLVAGGCYLSVLATNRYWQEQFALLNQRFDERLDVLRQEIKNNAQNPGTPGGELVQPGEQLTASQIYQQNVNSVVAIVSKVRTTNSYGQISEYTSSGTGFVLTADGYIVTNHHVIDGATQISFTMYDGTEYAAVLIGSDSTNDIALLKADAQDLQPVTIGSSTAMQVGDQVVAIGNALGELSSSLTVGYVSGIDRDIATDGSVINMIQTDAAINSGNSGGPLFNARGEVIGITTAKYSGTTSSGASIEGISFAIPIDDVIGMLEDLREFGYIRSAYLGVMVREMDPDVAAAYGLPMGVYVNEVTIGNCAANAGVRAKDIIIGLGGYEIESMNDLSRALRAYEAGETITITVWRSGQEVILEITLDAKPQS